MTTAALLADLESRGVTVTVEATDVVVSGPDSVLATTVVAELKARKTDILRLRGGATLRLVLVRHEHRCRCGRHFKCTAPSCAGRDILCVCCKLDEMERRHADRRSIE